MASKKIRVGIIGASPQQGWASRSHVPALQASPDYGISAVGTTRVQSAREAARLFGAEHAFTDARQLVEHPDVDLVVVAVRVPFHAELVRAALAAGKHVYCEWPLGLGSEESAALVEEASAAGVHHAVGLQGRYAQAVVRARQLIAEDFVGRVTSVTFYSAVAPGAGGTMPQWMAYVLDPAFGVGTAEVVGGHSLDTLQYVLGDITGLSASTSLQHPAYTIAETGETVTATEPETTLLNATLASGAVVSAHMHNAKITDSRTRLEVSGTKGDLLITSAGGLSHGIQMDDLRLFGTSASDGGWQELPLPGQGPGAAPAEPALVGNVGRLYGQLAEDIRTGTRVAPGFDAAARVHRLLDTVRESDRTGTRQDVPRRP